MASKRSYGKKVSGWRGKRDGHRKSKGRRSKGDNPHIRQKKGEARSISLGEEYEVNYARREGQVKVNKKTGAVSPVRGKTHVSHGRLVRNN
jgi:hypothetical protein